MIALSVVIPTFNRAESLGRTLAALNRCSLDPPFEVIVVDDGSTDATPALLSTVDVGYPITVIRQTNGGPSAARNVGIERARGAIVLFTDDDCLASPGLLAAHVRAHNDSGDRGRVVSGPMPAADLSTLSPWTAWDQRRIEHTFDRLATGEASPTWRNLYTGNASIRRRDLLAADGFDAALLRAEDIELGQRLHRAGLEFNFEPDAVVVHRPERSFTSWQDIAASYGRTAVDLQARDGRPIRSIQNSDEFLERHIVVRAAASFSAHHQRRRRVLETMLRGLVRLGPPLKADRLTDAALSLLFNTIFFGAMADELNEPTAAITAPEGDLLRNEVAP